MNWLVIQDELGAPINADGIYQRFTELQNANSKARFMRDYRLLPHGEKESFKLCDDTRELDAIREVMDVCARLAAIAGEMGDGKRKATVNDLELIQGFERADGGAFLHIDLSNSYWYKRLLYQAVDYEYVPGEYVFAPIPHRSLIDDISRQDDNVEYPNSDPERFKRNSGTFKYSASLTVDEIKKLNKHDQYVYRPSMLSSISNRMTFTSFKPVRDLCINHPDVMCKYESDVDFWTDNELMIRAAGEDLRDVAGDIAHTLLLLHTRSIQHYFSFWDGFGLFAPMGVCALWADFSQDVAKRPICICQTCGRPVVETHAPRGLPRVYCSDACRMRDKRRIKKQAQELASADK